MHKKINERINNKAIEITSTPYNQYASNLFLIPNSSNKQSVKYVEAPEELKSEIPNNGKFKN